MKICGKRNGFTLVELMIAMVSGAVLAGIVSLILFMTYRSWRTDNEYARLRRDTAFAVQLMAKEIRNSSYNGITVSANSLLCPTNAVHPTYTTTFTRNAASGNLTYFINGTSQGQLITKGLTVFSPLKQTNGVLLQLVLANTDGSIALTNQTFISVGNN
jgi:prepilin-type N-terminal cleavage/methylation domain-containing protein